MERKLQRNRVSSWGGSCSSDSHLPESPRGDILGLGSHKLDQKMYLKQGEGTGGPCVHPGLAHCLNIITVSLSQ